METPLPPSLHFSVFENAKIHSAGLCRWRQPTARPSAHELDSGLRAKLGLKGSGFKVEGPSKT